MKGSQIRMQRRLDRKYGPDTRPKWNEVGLRRWSPFTMNDYDRQPRKVRNLEKEIWWTGKPQPNFSKGE